MRDSVRTASLLRRGVANLVTSKPLCVSFEITHNCNARCGHCHLGERVRENRAPAARFGEIYRELRSPVVLVSGGEPTTRGDLEDIIKAIRQPDGTPYVVLVTNGSLLTQGRFRKLRDAGVDHMHLSLDFPDERHDAFRRIPGLFGRIRDFILDLPSAERHNVMLSAVVMSQNFRELVPLAELALSWGVGMNFSTYTWLRTGDRTMVVGGDDLAELEGIVEGLVAFKNKNNTIRTADYILHDMVRFFREETRPGCRAGERFLVVNPDATLSPCGLIMAQYRSQKEVLRQFSKNNTCSSCNTSIRALAEHPFNSLVMGGIRGVKA